MLEITPPDEPIPEIQVDEPVNLRPDLSEYGIVEVERGICEDTFENRSLLRKANMGWDAVYSTNGVPTGLIQGRSRDMATAGRLLSLAEKKPVLVKPDDVNSDYLTGFDLLIEPSAERIVPAWVMGATKMWRKEQNDPIVSEKRNPTYLPHRCNTIKDDGIRCMLWSSGRPKDDGLCRVHLRHISKKPGEDIERARRKIMQAAPYAVDMLEDLMQNAVSEPVKLKASTEILDRAGIRGGIELDASVSVHDARPAAAIISERLARLKENAIDVAVELTNDGVNDAQAVEEATVVEEKPE
jgi:hypothetical protein